MQIRALKIIKVGVMTLLSRRVRGLKKKKKKKRETALGVTTQQQQAALLSEIRNNEGQNMRRADIYDIKRLIVSLWFEMTLLAADPSYSEKQTFLFFFSI